MMCLPTVLARARRDEQSYLREDMSYGTAEIAYAMGQAHLAYYRLLEQQGHLRMIGSAGELDDHINRLLQRGAVIGAVLDIWMLKPWPQHFFAPDGYRAIDSVPRDQAKLSLVVDHIDHICQLAGDCAHVAIGTDLDGGFGAEQSPGDLDTIADLQKLDALLAKRGYSDADIDAICHGNWLRFFRDHLPS